MANFIFNNKLINENSKKIDVEVLMHKYLTKTFGDVSKIIDINQFFEALQTANFTHSCDIAILMLKKFNVDISNEENLEKVKDYLLKCLSKEIVLFNKQIKDDKVTKSSFYREINAKQTTLISEEAIDTRNIYNTFDILVNYLTNAILSAELIYTAENITIQNLQQSNQLLEEETVIAIDNYVKRNLNLNSILVATNDGELPSILKQYQKKPEPNKKMWHYLSHFFLAK